MTTPTEDALVARLEALSSEFAATPDEEFRAATRARLVAMAAVRTTADGTAARRPPARAGMLRRLLADDRDEPVTRWRSRLTVGLAGAALTVTAVGGLLGAAQQARPGDLLYDVKRGGEQTQLALAGESGRGETLLDFASTRLDELSELLGVQPHADAVVGTTPSGGEAGLAADGPDVDLVLDTLQTMDEQTTEGAAATTARAVEDVDGRALQELSAWAGEQRSGLGELTEAMPAGALGALDASLDLLDAVAVRGAVLEEAVSCPGGPATRGSDELGPLAAACVPPAQATSRASSPSGSGSSGSNSSGSGSAGSAGTASTSASTSGSTSGSPGSSASSGSSGTADTSAGSTAPSGTSSGSTSAPAPTSTPAPTTSGPGTPSTAGTTTAPPSTSPSPGPSLPSVPGLPSISVPSLPGSPSTTPSPPLTSPPGASGPLIDVPPLVPGVTVCVPPLVGLGC